MIKMTFLGDIMCDNAMAETMERYYDTKDNKYNFESVFSHIKPMLSESDYVVANLETPISINNQNLTNMMWTFNSPFEFAEAVKRCGVDFVSTANNHCLDAGENGLISTLQSLDSLGIEHCGTQIVNHNSRQTVKVGSLKVGILAYTYGTNAFSNRNYLDMKHLRTVNLLQEQEGLIKDAFNKVFHGHFQRVYRHVELLLYPENKGKDRFEKETFQLYRKILIRRDIKRIKKEHPDFLIALLHIGGQYNEEPTVYTKKVGDWFLKMGCDAVIGNHEHVIHRAKYTDDQFVAYALGNCLGSAGVITPPFDKLSDYSIALHIYFDEKTTQMCKVSFSVLKTVISKDERVEVWPVDILVQSCEIPPEEKEKIKKETLHAAKLFSEKEYGLVLGEFEMYNIQNFAMKCSKTP